METAAGLYDILFKTPPWLLGALIGFSYLAVAGLVRLFLRPVIISPFDPLNIILLTNIVPAIVGFLLVPILTNSASESFFWILCFLLCWLIIIRSNGKPGVISLEDNMGSIFPMVLLWLTVTITVLHLFVNMILPGKIPLLTEGGAASRFDATSNSRLLTWLALGTGPIAGTIYALTQNLKVRRLAIFAVAIQMMEGILFASKSGILVVFFILLHALFVAKERNEQGRYRKLRRLLLYACVLVGPLIPLYLIVIGVGSDAASLATIGMRFLQGFDQLILAAQFNMLHQKPFASLIGSSIVEYQLMPFFKAAFANKYVYSNIGQYVVEAATGVYIEGPFTFPNSNLILETIFTSGKYFGLGIFFVEMCWFYRVRVAMLRRVVTPWSVVLISTTVFDPAGLFLDGQAWVVETVLISFVILLALIITRLWNILAQISQASSHPSTLPIA